MRATVLVVHRYHCIDALLLVLYGPGTMTLILQMRKPYSGGVMWLYQVVASAASMDEQPVDCELGHCSVLALLPSSQAGFWGYQNRKIRIHVMTHSRVKCYRNVMYSFLLCCLQLIYHTKPIWSKLACNIHALQLVLHSLIATALLEVWCLNFDE